LVAFLIALDLEQGVDAGPLGFIYSSHRQTCLTEKENAGILDTWGVE
jgi:hypothetical protein